MKDYIKVNELVYDKLADEYKERLKIYEKTDRVIVDFYISYLKKQFSQPNVLELGPGSGLILRFFDQEGFNTSAIDISKNIIKVSSETSPNTKYIQADFLEYDFREQRYDGIFAKAFIHLFTKDDAASVLKKIHGLLNQKGAVFLSTTVHHDSEEGYFEKSDYDQKVARFRKRWTEQELLDEVEKVGFVIIQKEYFIEPEKNKKWVYLTATKSRTVS